MGVVIRGVGRKMRGAKTDGTYGTHETNAISLCLDTELVGGTLMVL